MTKKKWIVFALLIAFSNAQAEFEEHSGPETETQDELEEKLDKAAMAEVANHTTTTTTLPPTTTKDICHCDMEIYTVENMKGVIKSPNFPDSHCGSGKCMYKILPHPNMSLHVHIDTASFSSDTTLKIWDIIPTPNGEYNLFKIRHAGDDIYSTNNFDNYDHFTTAKNVGIKMVFEMHRNQYHRSGFKIQFERIEDEKPELLCPPAHVLVEAEETEVSVKKDFETLAGCTFLLSPSMFKDGHQGEEMFINIETEEGVYVAIRSYDEQGLFSRDSPSDENRGKVVDSKRVEVLFRKRSSAEGVFKAPRITARLTNNSCACPPSVVDMNKTYLFDLYSPGYPDLYCPEKKCTTIIKAGGTANRTANKYPILLIITNCSLAEHDILRLSSVSTDRVIFRTNAKNRVQTKFLRPIMIEDQDLKLTFEATKENVKRFFDMNFWRLYLRKECTCSLYDEKSYRDSGWISIRIPASCPIVHCHWKFSAGYSYAPQFISVRFSMSHPSEYDSIYLISDDMGEEYMAEQLKYEQQASSPISPLDFTLSRYAYQQVEDSVLNITWATIPPCTCAKNEYHLKSEESVVITSPNYPSEYCPNILCRHTFYAPEDHFLEIRIDKADIERYHDYLKIYDGNSTNDSMLAKVTGLYHDRAINSTGNTVYFVFNTDESTSRTGYHANVIAHPFPHDNDSKGYVIMILVFLVLVIGVVSAGSYYVFRKKQNYRQLQSMNNPTVSYTSTENGSLLNVAFSPSTETSTASEMETELL